MLRLVPVEIDDIAVANTATLPAAGRVPEPPRPASTELPEGLRLGHFRIDKKLGAGGMGEVYLATDVALDRPVAVKVLPSGVTSGAARERLIREARAQARIQHPNVAHIYFIGEEDGRLYFAMEHLAGQTLADRVAAGPLSVDDAIAAIRAAALGLREAQRSGFTHRDVKPSNLMSDAHGIVKVLDFGLVAAVPETADGPVDQTSLAGTPLYMAPEQAKGRPIDLRADIYALGATLYHLVSGQPPFVADSVDELLSMHATALRPRIPKKGHARTDITAIDSLIKRMMAPDPADRFQTYDELLRDLDLMSSHATRPAGAWVRAIATLIDFIVVSLLTVLVALPFSRDVNLDDSIGNALLLVYMTVTLARWGTSAGKAILELQVVAIADNGKPSLTRAFVREVAEYGPTVIASIITRIFKLDAVVPAIVAGITILALFFAAWRVPGKRAWWDRISGTQVRYRVARRPNATLLP